MTRQEFIDSVNSFYDLIDFCNDERCYLCEDVIDDDQLDECVEEDIAEYGRGWRGLRDWLADIPTGYEYYRRDGAFDYVWLDDQDFENYKQDVLEWADEANVFEEEEKDEEDDEELADARMPSVTQSHYFFDPISGERYECGPAFAMASREETAQMLF